MKPAKMTLIIDANITVAAVVLFVDSANKLIRGHRRFCERVFLTAQTVTNQLLKNFRQVIRVSEQGFRDIAS